MQVKRHFCFIGAKPEGVCLSTGEESSPEAVVREIKRKTRWKFSSEERSRIVLEGLRGERSIAAIYRREGISPNLCYRWSKSFLEAGKRRLTGDTMRRDQR